MYVVVSILIFIAALLLILIVLVQNSKGGGLASNFSGGNQALGVRKTTDFLEKATWSLAIALLVFSIAASATIPRAEMNTNQAIMEEVDFSQRDNIQDFSNFEMPAENTEAPATQELNLETTQPEETQE